LGELFILKVINLRDTKIYDIYIGRKQNCAFHYGNPFSHLSATLAFERVNSREEAVEAYRAWLMGEKYQEIEPRRRQWILDHVIDLKDKTLGCFCAPLSCHGDILLQLIS
jgi:Domain of unknown function (DUF4326)